jgi:hypothetical protein
MKAVFRNMWKRPGPVDHWLAILAVVLGGGAVIQLAYEAFTTPRGTPAIFDPKRPPEVMKSSAHPGGELKVRVYREKTRDDCPVNSQRLLINDATGAVLSIGEVLWEGGPSETDFVDVDYPMPTDLPSGGYTLRVYLSYLCPEKTFYVTQPDVHFKVTQ